MESEVICAQPGPGEGRLQGSPFVAEIQGGVAVREGARGPLETLPSPSLLLSLRFSSPPSHGVSPVPTLPRPWSCWRRRL